MTQVINYNFTFIINSAVDVPSITINGDRVTIQTGEQTKQVTVTQPETPDFSKIRRRIEHGLDRLATLPEKLTRKVSPKTKTTMKRYQNNGPQKPTNLNGFTRVTSDRDLIRLLN